MLAKGIKKQVLGGVLFCLGVITVLSAKIFGFELDVFYVVISIFGASLFLYGSMQRKQQILANEPPHLCGYCTEPEATDGVHPHRSNIAA